MSRIGKQPIEVPAGVTVSLEGQTITVVGPKGTLTTPLLTDLSINQADGKVTVAKVQETAQTQNSYGLMRTLIANMVTGVSAGFERQLEINGVGYRASVSGSMVNLALGFSHPVNFPLPEGITAKVEKNIITISGFDKQLVGQVAANIRALKKPEPYKGKGIKYTDEVIRRKAGKTATKA
jgi:large subunit ribosomal protein L6